MADLSQGEQELFAKYWGHTDLLEDDGFWLDVFLHFMATKTRLALPIIFNPYTVRRIHEWLECPPGVCAACCHYPKIRLEQDDIDRIVENNAMSAESLNEIIEQDGEGKYLPCQPNCTFLENNTCNIYDCRPNGCWLYPIQGFREAFADDKPFQQMIIRIECIATLNVVRKVFREVMKHGDRLLLPDLSLVPINREDIQDG